MATKLELKRARGAARDAKAAAQSAIVQVPIGTALSVGAQFAVPELAKPAVGAAAAGALVLSAFRKYPGRALVVGVSAGLLVPHVQGFAARMITRLRQPSA